MNAPPEADHMPQLDTLRAFAFIGVAVSHWTPSFLIGIVPWGTGVQLFFVLSGFLITGILLRSRPADLGLPMSSVLRVFYARRFLRIFPLYYGVLALSLIFAVGPILTTWPWHVSYLSNWHYARHGHEDPVTDPFLHFWSLSVEEQFYLLWPLVALVSGRRALFYILVGTVVGSMGFRVAIAHFAEGITTIRYLTPCCLDALAIGGLLAYARHYRGSAAVRRLVPWFAAVGVIGLGLCTVPLARLIDPADAHRIGHTFLVIFYGALVGWAAVGVPGLAGRILNLRLLRYLGRISYGLYVYHYFAPYVVTHVAKRAGWDGLLASTPATLVAYSIFTLVVAVISWHAYEYPINRLKRFFAYPRTRATGPLPAGIAPVKV